MRALCWGLAFGLGVSLLPSFVQAEPPTNEQIATWERVLARAQTSREWAENRRDALEQARTGLVALPPARLAPILRRMLQGPSADGRIEAAGVASRVAEGYVQFLPLLIENCRDQYPRVQRASLLALTPAARLGDVARSQAVRAAMPFVAVGDATAIHALWAIERLGALDAALARLSWPQLVAVLRRAVDLTDHTVDAKALSALRSKLVGPFLEAKGWRVRDAALAAVAEDEELFASWRPRVAQMLASDESGAVRHRAVQVFASAAKRDASYASSATVALNDPSRMVRAAAFGVVRRYDLAKDEKLAAQLLRMLEETKGLPGEHSAVIQCLRAAPQAIALQVRPALKHENRQVRSAAAATLYAHGVMDDELVPVVLQWIGQAGVSAPFSGRGHYLGRGDLFPRFNPSASFVTQVVRDFGDRLAADLYVRLSRAIPDERIRWIFAIGTMSEAGRKALAEMSLSDSDARARALVLAREGVHSTAVIGDLVQALSRDYDRMVIRALVHIGAPAKTLVEEAARGEKAGGGFREVLEQLR